MLDKLFYLILFAAGGALLYGWGLAKSARHQQELAQMLYEKGQRILQKELRHGSDLSRREAEVLLRDIQVRPLGSRAGCKVTEPAVFTQALLDKMVTKGILSAEGSGKKVRYVLRAK